MQRIKHLLNLAAAPACFLLLVLIVWESVTRLLRVPSYLLPSPTMIVSTVASDFGSLLAHTAVTMAEAVTGFALANVLGFGLATLFAHSQTAQRAIYPYAIALKTTPVVAIAPLLVVWFGTGIVSKIIASALICFFPILVNATRGLRAVDQEAVDLFQSLAASKAQVFAKLRLPNSLPYVFSALKISTSLSVVGAIVGEFVGAQRGLGYLILVSSYHLESNVLFAAILAAAFGGSLFFASVVILEQVLVPWAAPVED